MVILVVMNMFNSLKTLQEMYRSDISHATLQSVEDRICAFAAESAAMPAGEVIVSVDFQRLVKKIVTAEDRYLNNKVHWLGAFEDNQEFRQEHRCTNYEDYQISCTELIQRLETAIGDGP